jgi:peroxiredoxin-like protein
MQELPHYYKVKASGEKQGNLKVTADNLPEMLAAPPIGFNGPGDIWSPEDMLMSSVATCTILSFRAISRASKLDWISIECEANGELSRVERVTQFTKIMIKVKLLIPKQENFEKAVRLLNKAEQTCLISNSLTAETHIECEVVFQS